MQGCFKCNRSLEKILCQSIGTDLVLFSCYLAKEKVVGKREIAESDLLELLEEEKKKTHTQKQITLMLFLPFCILYILNDVLLPRAVYN